MSAFVVLVQLNGAYADLDLVRDLARIVSYRGPDACGSYAGGSFAAVHHMLKLTRACCNDVQPVTALSENFVLVCDARLDDRQTLIRSLRDSGSVVGVDSPHSQLLLESLRIWGDDALERISGDYSFVLLDKQRSRIFSAVDPFGSRLLYYGSFRGGVIISNDPLPIMAHPKIGLGLSRLAMADFLLTGRITGIDRTLTPFQAIRQLAEGHRLCIDLESGGVDVARHWHFPMQDKAIYYRSLDDYLEHFRSVMKEAIADRIDAPSVVAPMSGGMDSTTVVGLASEVMRERAGPDRFTALTAVRGEDDVEGLLARETCDLLSVAHQCVRINLGKPLQNWKCHPFPEANFFSQYEDNQRESSSFGRLSLNASSADYALCPERFSLIGQWQAAGLSDTLRALGIMKSRFGFRPPLGSGVCSRIRGRYPVNPYTQPPYAYPSWLSPDLEQELSLKDRWHAHWSRWPIVEHRIRPTAHAMITGRGRLSMHSVGWPLDFPLPLPADPFLDQRVINFLWSLPPLPWFFDKYLTRNAMKGRLPDSVISRRKTPAGKWVPDVRASGVDFSWEPVSFIEEWVNVQKLPDLNANTPCASDFHPMFLNMWLASFPDTWRQKLNSRSYAPVFKHF